MIQGRCQNLGTFSLFSGSAQRENGSPIPPFRAGGPLPIPGPSAPAAFARMTRCIRPNERPPD